MQSRWSLVFPCIFFPRELSNVKNVIGFRTGKSFSSFVHLFFKLPSDVLIRYLRVIRTSRECFFTVVISSAATLCQQCRCRCGKCLSDPASRRECRVCGAAVHFPVVREKSLPLFARDVSRNLSDAPVARLTSSVPAILRTVSMTVC